MSATVLGLAAAGAFGVSDFAGGLAARRMHFMLVSVISQSIGAIVACSSLALTGRGSPATGAVLWGTASGFGSALGVLALYRGLGRGEMAVAGPLSAVAAAALPALVGILLGEQLSPVAITGVVLALPAIWLVGRAPAGPDLSVRAGALDGLLAGAGFALLFIGLDQAGGRSGLWPVATGQVTALLVIAVAVAVRRPPPSFVGSSVWMSVAGGALGISASILYFDATHVGLLTIVAVLASCYPGITVLMAAVLLHERPSRSQLGGLAMCAAAVTTISLG